MNINPAAISYQNLLAMKYNLRSNYPQIRKDNEFNPKVGGHDFELTPPGTAAFAQCKTCTYAIYPIGLQVLIPACSVTQKWRKEIEEQERKEMHKQINEIAELLNAANIPRKYEDANKPFQPKLKLVERIKILIMQRDYLAAPGCDDMLEQVADMWIAEHKQPKPKPELNTWQNILNKPPICSECGLIDCSPYDDPTHCQCIPF